MNEKFCSSCWMYRKQEGGVMRVLGRGKVTRWTCVSCMARRSEQRFASKEKESA